MTAAAETAPSRSSISAGRSKTLTGTTTAPSPESPEVRLDERRRVRQHDRHAVARADAVPASPPPQRATRAPSSA